MEKTRKSTPEFDNENLPPSVKIEYLQEVADKIRENTQTHWIREVGSDHLQSVGAYEEYLHSMDVERGVGQGRVLLAVYTGEPLTFIGAERSSFTLRNNSVVGHIVSKPTGIVRENVLREALELRNQETHPRELYKKLKQEMPLNWNLVDGFHAALRTQEATGFLAFVNVHPQVRRIGLSKSLIGNTLKRFLDEDNLNYAFAFARVPGFPKSGEPDIQEYVLQKDSSEKHIDFGIRIHQNVGQTVICGIPEGAIDSASMGFAVLVASDLGELRKKGMI